MRCRGGAVPDSTDSGCSAAFFVCMKNCDDIVIYCPGVAHRQERKNSRSGEKVQAIKKILFVASPDSCGNFKVQCSDNLCRKLTADINKGWYEITVDRGNITVEPVVMRYQDRNGNTRERRFGLTPVPYALKGGN